MNICLFTPEEINAPLSVKDSRGEHIIKVLHKNVGDSFFAGIINKQSGNAKITQIKDGNIYFTFEPNPQEQEKLLIPLKMIIGFPRPIQLKRLLRDIAALGVCEVHLTGTELGEKSYLNSNLSKEENAYQMLLDGTVQAASAFVPKIFIHNSLNECIKKITQDTESLKLALDNVNPKCSLKKALSANTPKSAIAAIGSERGWTDKERAFLEENKFIRCSMGKRVMRTETAATVAASIISFNFGFMD